MNPIPRSDRRTVALVAMFTVTAATAQDPRALAVPPVSPILAGPAAPDGTPSGTWASGHAYKARFDGGMTFHPYVGGELPHQPVAWRTLSVRAGASELLVPGTTPVLRHDAWRAEYDHGRVVERYDVRADGLAQSFVIAERPAAGDLVVTGEVTTPLVLAPHAAAHAPLTLRLPDGRDVVEYGAATAIDANGVSTPMTTAVDGHRIVLRLAAEAVAAAAFPLVVDPLLASTLLRQGPQVTDVDVLHETLTGTGLQARLWVAHTFLFAANDSDVRLFRYGSAFGGTGIEVYRETSIWSSEHARLALAPGANRVVLVHSIDTGSGRGIFAHRHDVGDQTLSTTADFMPQFASESFWRPDVAGRRNTTGSRVLIVTQREGVNPFAETPTSQIYACVYDAAAANPFSSFPFAVNGQPSRDQERPVVNQAASSNDWLLAFQEHNPAIVNDDWDIEMFAVDGTGAVSASVLSTEEAGDSSRHKVGPQIAGGGGRYLLTYATRTFEQGNPKPTSVEGQVVRSQRVDWDHVANTGTRPWPAVDLFAPGTVTIRACGVAFDFVSTSHWCASLRNDQNTSYRVFKLGYTGNVVESANLGLATGATPVNLAIGFNQDTRAFPIVYGENDGSAATNAVQGTQMTYDTIAAPTLLGFACGTGAWSAVGTIAERQQIGAQAMPLQMAGAPLDSVAILFVSTAALPIDGGLLGAPGCTLQPDVLLPNYLGSLAFSLVGGACGTTLDLPEYLAPMTLTMQWVYLVPGANPLGMLASEGLSVQVGR